MRLIAGCVMIACTLTLGCGDTSNAPSQGISVPDNGTPASNASGLSGTESSGTVSEASKYELTPENTTVQFVGTHVGEPNPRTGGFEKFSGSLQVDAANSTLKAVSLSIETQSLWTQIPNLTAHLKNPDFFEVREFPTASFESTRVEAGGAGEIMLTGDLTLHGVTKEISFPATVTFGDGDPKLKSDFSINRTDFGMNWGLERVVDEVTLTIIVGQKTEPLAQQEQAAGGRGGRRGRFDPAQMFAQRDANQDGKLDGDEISGRMRENLEATDTDGDGAISLKEFQERMRQFAGRGGGRGGGGRRGEAEGGQERPQRPE